VQNAYSEARKALAEIRLSFSPAHVLKTQRPLGRINRARLIVYSAMSDLRRQQNGQSTAEPANFLEISD
jgi:hypothetical protein